MPQAPQTSLDVLNQLDQTQSPTQTAPSPAPTATAAGPPAPGQAPPTQQQTSLDVLNQLDKDPEAAYRTGPTITGPSEETEGVERYSVTGQRLNDVGNVVIVPKKGESYLDTIQRALAYHHSLTPQQQQEAIQREMQPRKLATKTAEVAAGAVGAGAAGVIVPSEMAAGLNAASAALVPALTRGVVGFNEWMAAHPMMKQILMEGLKWAFRGSAFAAGASVVGKGIKAYEAPE